MDNNYDMLISKMQIDEFKALKDIYIYKDLINVILNKLHNNDNTIMYGSSVLYFTLNNQDKQELNLVELNDIDIYLRIDHIDNAKNIITHLAQELSFISNDVKFILIKKSYIYDSYRIYVNNYNIADITPINSNAFSILKQNSNLKKIKYNITSYNINCIDPIIIYVDMLRLLYNPKHKKWNTAVKRIKYLAKSLDIKIKKQFDTLFTKSMGNNEHILRPITIFEIKKKIMQTLEYIDNNLFIYEINNMKYLFRHLIINVHSSTHEDFTRICYKIEQKLNLSYPKINKYYLYNGDIIFNIENIIVFVTNNITCIPYTTNKFDPNTKYAHWLFLKYLILVLSLSMFEDKLYLFNDIIKIYKLCVEENIDVKLDCKYNIYVIKGDTIVYTSGQSNVYYRNQLIQDRWGIGVEHTTMIHKPKTKFIFNEFDYSYDMNKDRKYYQSIINYVPEIVMNKYININTLKYVDYNAGDSKEWNINNRYAQQIRDYILNDNIMPEVSANLPLNNCGHDTFGSNCPIEFATRNHLNTTIEKVVAELREIENKFLLYIEHEEAKHIYAEYAEYASYPFVEYEMGHAGKNIMVYSKNSNFHINLTLPILTNFEVNDESQNDINNINKQIKAMINSNVLRNNLVFARLLQLLSPMLMAIYNTPNFFSIFNDYIYNDDTFKYSKCSNRVAKLCTSTLDTHFEIKRKLYSYTEIYPYYFWITEQMKNLVDLQHYKYHIPIDFRRDPEKNETFGFELRIFDGFDPKYLEALLRFIIMVADYAYILISNKHNIYIKYEYVLKFLLKNDDRYNADADMNIDESNILIFDECFNIFISQIALHGSELNETTSSIIFIIIEMIIDLFVNIPYDLKLISESSKDELIDIFINKMLLTPYNILTTINDIMSHIFSNHEHYRIYGKRMTNKAKNDSLKNINGETLSYYKNMCQLPDIVNKNKITNIFQIDINKKTALQYACELKNENNAYKIKILTRMENQLKEQLKNYPQNEYIVSISDYYYIINIDDAAKYYPTLISSFNKISAFNFDLNNMNKLFKTNDMDIIKSYIDTNIIFINKYVNEYVTLLHYLVIFNLPRGETKIENIIEYILDQPFIDQYNFDYKFETPYMISIRQQDATIKNLFEKKYPHIGENTLNKLIYNNILFQVKHYIYSHMPYPYEILGQILSDEKNVNKINDKIKYILERKLELTNYLNKIDLKYENFIKKPSNVFIHYMKNNNINMCRFILHIYKHIKGFCYAVDDMGNNLFMTVMLHDSGTRYIKLMLYEFNYKEQKEFFINTYNNKNETPVSVAIQNKNYSAIIILVLNLNSNIEDILNDEHNTKLVHELIKRVTYPSDVWIQLIIKLYTSDYNLQSLSDDDKTKLLFILENSAQNINIDNLYSNIHGGYIQNYVQNKINYKNLGNIYNP